MNIEMHLCPPEYQSCLTHLGGVNRYDHPNFILWWSQYAHGPGSFRAGGVWSVDEQYYKGYRDLLKGTGEPCWCLGQWNPPEAYGAPESYYVQNFDSDTGLQTLGEYPYSGRYEVLYSLRFHEMVNGRLEFFSPPLSFRLLEMIVPVILAARDIGYEKRRAAYLDQKARDEAAHTSDIERRLMDSSVPFTHGVSYARQGIRSTVIDQKMLAMQRDWQQISKNARNFRKGLQTRTI